MVTALNTLSFAISVFCIATMFALGLDVTLTDVVAPFRNWLAVAIIALANSVIVPLLVVVILVMPTMLWGTVDQTINNGVVHTDRQQIGFLLVALAAGGILGPTLTKLAKGSVALAKGTTILLVLISSVLMPLEVELVGKFQIDGFSSIRSIDIFKTLLFYQLLPLTAGIAIKVWYEAIAALLQPRISQLATLSFLILLVLLPATGNVQIWTLKEALVMKTNLITVEINPNEEKVVVEGLNQGKVQGNLESALGDKRIQLTDNATISQDSGGLNRWIIIDADKKYLVQINNKKLIVDEEVSKLPDMVVSIVNWLYKLPTVATMMDFAGQLGSIALPLIGFSIVATIIMTIGYYVGVLINNANGTTTMSVAHTQSIAAAVRNVSAALIVAARDFRSTTGVLDPNVVEIILVFYLVSLIVAAIQADKWSRQPETAPVTPASQSQAAVIAPERGAMTP